MDDAQVQIFGQARPPLIQHQFSDQDQAKHMNFLDKLESWLGRSTNFRLLHKNMMLQPMLEIRKAAWRRLANVQSNNWQN